MTRSITMPEPATNVIKEMPSGLLPAGGALGLVISAIASAADTISPWGNLERDAQLRVFWPTEPYFASGLFNTIAQYVAFGFTLSGPPRTVAAVQEMFYRCERGAGYQAMMSKVLTDYFTQDNGAFIEVVRTEDDPSAPVIAMNHLDSQRCIRTGRHMEPVFYIDLYGNYHRLKWYNVICLTEMPSPIEAARGMQYCVLTRILRGAQIMRDIGIVKHEKAAGRFTRQVHLVSGVQTRLIEDAIQQKQAAADQAGLLRYIQPLIIASLDPTARVTKETIDLASVPDDWDEEKALRSYITLMSMAFGSDYQNFAPLPGGGLGSSAQSKVLNMKSRGKGPGLFMKKMEGIFNFHGIVPRSIKFAYGDQDSAEQQERNEVEKGYSETLEIQIRAGLITTEVGRQLLVDKGYLAPDYLKMMREENATEEVDVPSTVPADQYEPGTVKPGMAGPKEPPKAAASAGAIDRPVNSNNKRPKNPATNDKRNPGGPNTPERSTSAT